MDHPPKSLQPLLWSTDVNLLDIDRDKHYIIHQLLLYGTFKHLHWLLKAYSKKEIVDTFINHPVKMYPKSMFFYVKNYLLNLPHVSIDEQKYVTSISGPIRQRTAERFS